MKNSVVARLVPGVLRPGVFCIIVALMMVAASVVFASDTPDAGMKVYINHCASCHEGGFKGWITGAPKTGDNEEWAPFLKTGAATMTKNTIGGTKGMEPNGGCNDCTAEQIHSAVQYILSISQ